MRNLRNSISVLNRLGIVPLAIWVCLGLAASVARAQLPPPSNDNFVDAEEITGLSGAVNGSNIGATVEPGEVTVLELSQGASVWYKWTAPQDGEFTFDTTGSEFDTLLGVYTGDAVDALTIISENDDAGSAGLRTSKVTFNAVNGTTYYLAVDGFWRSRGTFRLNWRPSGAAVLLAGDFQFTSPFYLTSERETFSSRWGHMRYVDTRLTVTRLGGAMGRVLVNYSITHALYTNEVIYTWFGTNVVATNSAGYVSNSWSTNIVVETRYQNCEYGQFTYLPVQPWMAWSTNSVGTNDNGNITEIITVTNGYFGSVPTANRITTTVSTDTNSTPPISIVSSVFSTNFTTNIIVAAAEPMVDYMPTSGTLVFNDYQMSEDILVPVYPNFTQTDVVLNRALVATIDSVALDPLESPAIIPPTASQTNALVNILDLDVVANPDGKAALEQLRGNPYITNVVNFERATVRCTRDVNGVHIANIEVVRSGQGMNQAISVPFRIDWLGNDPNNNNIFRGGGPNRFNPFMLLQAGSDYAIPPNPANDKYGDPPDFESVSGTVTIPAYQAYGTIRVPITNYNTVEFNKDLMLELYDPPGDPPTAYHLGFVRTCILTILFDTQPAGAVDRDHNPDNNANTIPPYNMRPGANDTVYAVAVQPDGSTVFGGNFTAYNTIPRNRVARMLSNGQLDTGFDPKDGADKFVTSLALDPSGSIIVAGAFDSFNRVPRSKIARLFPNGDLDTSFFPGQGANGTIWQIALQSDKKVIIAGEFTSFNGTNRNYIARLNADGSLDTSFDPGVGPNGPVYSIAVQDDGRVVLGGPFTAVDGVSRNCIARLNADGSLDTSFNPRSGAGGETPVVYTVALQPYNGVTNILVGGNFSAMYGVPRTNFARLNYDGSLDFSFNPGYGVDGIVYSTVVQPDGRLMIAGSFQNVNQTHRLGLARLLADGTVDTSFMDTAYNQFAGLCRFYADAIDPIIDPPGVILATARQPDGNIIVAGQFRRLGGGDTRDDAHYRLNIARVLGNETPGPGNIGLVLDNDFADDLGTNHFVQMRRDNGHLGPASVTVVPRTLPDGPGAAVAGLDFTFNATYSTPTWITTWSGLTWQLKDGTYGQNQGYSDEVQPNEIVAYPQNDVWITTYQSTNWGDKYLNLDLMQPNGTDIFLLGGENIPLGVALGRATSQLEIVDSHRNRGVLNFSAPTYITSEGSNAVITITRTGGTDGTIAVQFSATDGQPPSGAVSGVNYRAFTNTITMGPGIPSTNITVTVLNNSTNQGDRMVNLTLFRPMGGATLGSTTNALLTIVDDDQNAGVVEFTSGSYTNNETDGVALITLTRHHYSSGTLSVWFSTTTGTAANRVNYLAVTNRVTWNSGDVQPKTVSIPLLNDGVIEPGPLTVNLRLSSAAVNGKTNDFAYLGATANAVLNIVNTDSGGSVAFSSPTYSVNENGGFAIIPVVRTGGSVGSVTVNYTTLDGSAFSGVDYVATNGTLSFGPGEVCKIFTVPLLNNAVEDPDRFVALTLFSASPSGALAEPSTAVLSINDDETLHEPPGGFDVTLDSALGFDGNVLALALQPDGKLMVGGDFGQANGVSRNRLARLNADGSLDTIFSSTSPSAGPNDSVLAITVQTDQRIVVGGRFTTMNGVSRNFLARLNPSGHIDSTFNPGSGPSNTVYAITEALVGEARKLLVGGAFTTYNTRSYPYLVRLNDNGTLDDSFRPNPNGSVFAVALQPDGKILIGGDFTAVNGVGRSHIARLNANGSLDLTFDPGVGTDASVRAIAVQPDGRVVIGGLFAQAGGAPLNHIARLNANGHLDPSFAPGAGANDAVSSISLQADTRIVVGGQFTRFNNVTRNRIARLNPDGSVDTMINFGTGADSFVAATLVQTNGYIVLGGGFSSYNGQPAPRLARIYGGSVAGAGAFEFSAANYQVDEIGTNVPVTIIRRGGTSGTSAGQNVSVTLMTLNGTARAGSNYTAIATNLVFPPGETIQTVFVPVFRDYVITNDLTVDLVLTNPQPVVPGGPSLGNQATATLTIFNDDSAISFESAEFAVPETSLTGSAMLPVIRSGSTRLAASVDFFTTTNGTAVPDVNYLSVSNTVSFLPGQGTNYAIVPLLHDTNAVGNTTVPLVLSNAVNALLLSPSTALLTIVDVDSHPGQFLFAQTNTVVSETAGFVRVWVARTNGHAGTVTVQYNTVPGTATPGHNYDPVSGTLTFADGQTNQFIDVPIRQEDEVEPDGSSAFGLVLSNPSNGTSLLAPTNTTVTILDDEIGVAFSSPIYIVNEKGGSVTLTLYRVGTNGVTTLRYATTNVTAFAGTNYAADAGPIRFEPKEFIKTLTFTILPDPRVTGDLSFNVNLFDAVDSSGRPVQLYTNNPATVNIIDADPGIAFTNSVFGALKSAGSVLITVLRSNANTGDITVNYATTNGTAIAGTDYTNTFGQLTFSNGVTLQSFAVPIVSNRLVQGDRSFSVNLFNPSAPAQLISPSVATVVITDDISGLSFSSPTYSVNELGVSATISVMRSGYLDNVVSVDYATDDGTGHAGTNYLSASGTLTFTNGETLKTFSVTVIDDHRILGDKTVLLNLSKPIGNAVLVSPSAATLNIVEGDGSFIVPAGAALTYESGPTNGIIDPGEQVSLLFGLRNIAGTNSAHLVATLLATNGIANPSGPQNYGALVVQGPAASRPFSFTANATNGQTISATFLLQDGAFTNQVVFNFAIGRSTAVFSNPAAIYLNDAAVANPYPSTINVSGIGGSINRATVTFTNFNHTWPRDIDAVLVSPAGQKTYLMARSGGTYRVDGATIQFDDAAADPLPYSSLITNGTYRPTSYAQTVPPFPIPAPPAPYLTNLTALRGSNPNGTWSLYIIDDTSGNFGTISNGWFLTLNTSDPVGSAADLVLGLTSSPGPITVGSNYTYTLTVTNFGPSTAGNVMLTNELPAGAAFVSAWCSVAGALTTTNGLGQVTCNLGSLAHASYAVVTITVRSAAVGLLTDTAYVSSSVSDPNPANNAASVGTRVVDPSADLVLALVNTPDPVYMGGLLTYSITVSNLGPSTAWDVAVTNTLPAGGAMQFVSASPMASLTNGGIIAFTNLGSLDSGLSTNLSIVVRPLFYGLFSDTASVTSGADDPLKGNNKATVKAVVEAPPLSLACSANLLSVSWPAAANGYVLETATSLAPHTVWTPVVNPPSVQVGSQRVLTLGVTNSTRFFRLRAPAP